MCNLSGNALIQPIQCVLHLARVKTTWKTLKTVVSPLKWCKEMTITIKITYILNVKQQFGCISVVFY